MHNAINAVLSSEVRRKHVRLHLAWAKVKDSCDGRLAWHLRSYFERSSAISNRSGISEEYLKLEDVSTVKRLIGSFYQQLFFRRGEPS